MILRIVESSAGRPRDGKTVRARPAILGLDDTERARLTN